VSWCASCFQDSVDLRAAREERVEAVVGSDGVARRSVERSHERLLQTVFGEVTLRRLAYRQRGAENLYVADGELNLPEEKHSHGLRRLAALEAPKDSFEDAREVIHRHTGVEIGKRQVEQLALRAAVDFEAFYRQRERTIDGRGEDDVLVLSCDGKGVVMRPEALREQTKKKAESSEPKLGTRLSPVGRSAIASGSRRSPLSMRSRPPRELRRTSCPQPMRSARPPATGPRRRTSGCPRASPTTPQR
jgi:hypothetical protein